MSRWFGAASRAQVPMSASVEEAHLRQVQDALLMLLNDDPVSADKILSSADSSFHLGGRGISMFLSSMLGAESELLKDASKTIQEAENKAWEDMKRAQKDSSAYRSNIYPPGTEYLLCYVVSLLTGAICAVLSGSIVQAISGFTKLRKAFLILDGIMEIEISYFEKILTMNKFAATSSLSVPNGGNNLNQGVNLDPNKASTFSDRKGIELLDFDQESIGITSYTDIFIHSGTRLCYGILLVVFSMIENPLFTKILYLVGFKGDRKRGTLHLWQASRFNNFNSAIAGITVLMYYSGLIGFCDILPTDDKADEDLSAFPRTKFRRLLSDMRKRYPESKFWKLEEARLLAFDRNLTDSINILVENSKSNFKQISTISKFELALSSMFHHDYELMAKSWIQCADQSSWSPTLYAYMAGAAYFELYREKRLTDPDSANELKKKAITYFRKGPPLSGKQKLMSKQLPFDMYIVRKCQKWEERAKNWDVELTEAIGVSPLQEMIYLWSGSKKQNSDELKKSLEILNWDRTNLPEKHKSNLDETAIHALLKSCIYRNLEKYQEAREVLQKNIICHDKQEFRGHLKDDWTCANAHYEMACIAWKEKDLKDQDHRSKFLECEEWLEKVQKWGDQFILDTRLSMNSTTSMATLKRHREIMGF
ncbi:Inclusion body clearance protein iml2 [Erysiphe neolycopersici]|uniref:Inclusion body clearance protein IML2 n=1 Tax=Erysiphe neolycopersici TaxID=212602 RepID=A0A420HRP8_9PEZI|nr:Inclusion body clearance protein iml2 [Erysiphe neolycopersici]